MQDDIGKLVLRVSIGVLILMHGVHKLLTGIDPIMGAVAAHGLPSFLAYGVYIGEVLAPVLLIVGFFSRVGGIIIVINMIVAVLLVHMGDLAGIGPNGNYALELEVLYLVGGLCVALMGAGRISVGGGRWN